jgi:hypothetical protein
MRNLNEIQQRAVNKYFYSIKIKVFYEFCLLMGRQKLRLIPIIPVPYQIGITAFVLTTGNMYDIEKSFPELSAKRNKS